MNPEIEMKCELMDRRPMVDKNLYFSDKDQTNHTNVKKEILDNENRSPLPPPPPLTPKPPKLYEIGMKININQFKSISDPFLSDFEKIKKEEPQTEDKSPLNTKTSRRGRSRPAKMSSLKRRRNSASSDTSQSSSCSSVSSSSQDDCIEISDGPRERTKNRATNISNRKRLRIRDEIGNNNMKKELSLRTGMIK